MNYNILQSVCSNVHRNVKLAVVVVAMRRKISGNFQKGCKEKYCFQAPVIYPVDNSVIIRAKVSHDLTFTLAYNVFEKAVVEND